MESYFFITNSHKFTKKTLLFSDSYFTLSQAAFDVYKDKGSKFLAYAYPVKTELEIKAYLHSLKTEHPSANHHCYAWRLGADKAAFRANDDGEPTNTAGKPILMQIQAHDLTNILIVVVRYFGGTLLGVGGLIQAYKNSAQLVIAKLEIIEKFIQYEYQVEFDFDDMSAVMRVLKEHEAQISSTNYKGTNSVTFQIKKQFSEKLETRFKDLYKTKLCFISVV